eukprot:TRINITY_DN20215_c0_g1_i1.p1 TRINITY_DN20215_c0_g1~~TRINITY_DN20215_c0_g1_i1.p1  ORF type:complete len:337 (+),score=50.93 TRINITY_DN20215_c0_g1_i1:61-1011(+)
MAPAGSIVHGDHDQRISVPLPRSFPELQKLATRHFAKSGQHNLKMYHQGKTVVTTAKQLANIQGGDIVVIANPEELKQVPTVSTHQAHYTAHPLEERKPVVARGDAKEVLPFEGRSSYAVDYIEHPPQEHRSAAPPKAAWEPGRAQEKTGKSIYSSHFRWHELTPRQLHRQQQARAAPAPFEGQSSYRQDFIAHEARPRSAAGVRAQKSEQVELTGPFQGVSTYTTDYKTFDPTLHARPALNANVASLKTERARFEGVSEHHREYIPHSAEGAIIVHLEPELKRPGTGRPHSSRPSSARGGRTYTPTSHRPPSRRG